MKPRRRRGRLNGAADGQMSLTVPIANWPAKFAWLAAMWGLFPLVGLPLGLVALVLGLIGWRRVCRRPEDLGLRHARGGIILGSVELFVNISGLACIIKGMMELGLFG